ncbi:ras-related protein Rab-13-like [Paramacrobiotus metropolitanus]|uniref:ras-related protein Rab-13-like n=1 Tax=Paramacrobiotus metropolitanus TaxID=2943436 RepID=UPI002445E7D2|nr:ras-related protein Rab-13-like [Paramacrobiotus metropolitanus]
MSGPGAGGCRVNAALQQPYASASALHSSTHARGDYSRAGGERPSGRGSSRPPVHDEHKTSSTLPRNSLPGSKDMGRAVSTPGTVTPANISTSLRSSSLIGLAANYALPTDEIHMKIMMVGDTAVGKTSIVRRIVEDAFTYQENATVGLDFKIRRMVVDSTQVRLQIWDTAGQERFQSITTQYFNRAHGFFLVYDITNERSFRNCDKWMHEIRQKGQANVEIILLANKCDREEERKVPREAGMDFAKKHGLVSWEISAQSNTQIERAFVELMRKIIDRRKHELEENARNMEFSNSYTLLQGSGSHTNFQNLQKRCCNTVT